MELKLTKDGKTVVRVTQKKAMAVNDGSEYVLSESRIFYCKAKNFIGDISKLKKVND